VSQEKSFHFEYVTTIDVFNLDREQIALKVRQWEVVETDSAIDGMWDIGLDRPV
jgi:hypothetical protein